MRQAGLLGFCMALLGRVAIREPDCGPMAVHHGADHGSGAGWGGLMNNGIWAAEHPVIGVRALNPDPGLVRGDNLGSAECRHGLVAPGLKATLCPAEQV